ncbi:MAG: protease modulator HflC [Clostridia bacterium]|nr:protease modulator HflC [Clostridia bacterium]
MTIKAKLGSFMTRINGDNGKAMRIIKIAVALIIVVVLLFFMFTTEVREGSGSIILRFGAPRKVVTQSGLYFKLPWPFENVVSFDGRQQYLESDFLETTTKDNRNIILQSYAIWSVSDPLKYYNSVGSAAKVDSYIKDQIFSATNSVMGAYELSALVSLDKEKINTEEIQKKIFEKVRTNCENNYGITVTDVSILRISLPDTNLESVFEQMTADRQKDIDTILANAQRDANKIISDADAEAAQIIAEGEIEAADIRSKTETEVAEIYAQAQEANMSLYKFLKELDTLVASVDEDSVLVVTADSYPFNVLLEYAGMIDKDTSDEVIIGDLNYIMTQLPEEDRQAVFASLHTLLEEAEVA